MKLIILLGLVSCAGIRNNDYNSDIFYTRCYNSHLYYIRYDDPERLFIPVFGDDGERVRCSRTLGVDTKK